MYEACQRFCNPPAVASLGMLDVAAVGLVVNIEGMRLLRGGATESRNLKGAYFILPRTWSLVREAPIR